MGLSYTAEQGTSGEQRGKSLTYKGLRIDGSRQANHGRTGLFSLNAPSELKAHAIMTTFQHCGLVIFPVGELVHGGVCEQ